MTNLRRRAAAALRTWNHGQGTAEDEQLISELLQEQDMIPIERIRDLSDREDSIVPFLARVTKLAEEAGEVAAAALKHSVSSNASASADGDELAEELVDSMIVCLDLLAHLGLSNQEITELFNTKLDKWERKLVASERSRVPL